MDVNVRGSVSTRMSTRKTSVSYLEGLEEEVDLAVAGQDGQVRYRKSETRKNCKERRGRPGAPRRRGVDSI